MLRHNVSATAYLDTREWSETPTADTASSYNAGAFGIYGGDRASKDRRSGSEGEPPPPILVKCAITPTGGRKQSRLLRRFTELEGSQPELLKKGSCFITLTSGKVVTIEQGRLAAGRAMQWLRDNGYPYYVATTAIQPNRLLNRGESVEHVHIVVFGHRRVPAEGLRKAWGLGYTFHKTPHTVLGVVNYLGYMGRNFGRLSWSYALLKLIPGGAKPHVSCYRYFKPCDGFPGGVLNMGWGNLRYVGASPLTGEALVQVPALGRIVPAVAGCDHKLLWTCWRMTSDWQQLRGAMRHRIRDDNEFIDRLRQQDVPSTDSASPLLRSTAGIHYAKR